jgi:hypothetical protein
MDTAKTVNNILVEWCFKLKDGIYDRLGNRFSEKLAIMVYERRGYKGLKSLVMWGQ